MKPFTILTGIAAALLEENIDTDVIFPARFLLITARDGLGAYAFRDRREADAGFVLNRPPFDTACILIAGRNFGSGSSREQAVWAMLGFGIRCVIAPSFGEIFQSNCYRNGVLPIVLPQDRVDRLARLADAGASFTIDLEALTITSDGGATPFAVAPEQRLALINGWDDTTTILNTQADAIATFEARQRDEQPWLWEFA